MPGRQVGQKAGNFFAREAKPYGFFTLSVALATDIAVDAADDSVVVKRKINIRQSVPVSLSFSIPV